MKPEDRFPTADEFWRAVCEADLPPEQRGKRSEPKRPKPKTARAARLRSIAVTTALSLVAGGVLGLGLRAAFPGCEAVVAGVHRARGIGRGCLVEGDEVGIDAAGTAASTPSSTTCPDEMAMVDGGRFVMGADDGEASPSERPSHEVTLSPFCIDRKEVTVAAYKLCAEEGKCERAPFEVEWKGISRQQKKVFSPACNGDDPERSVHPVNCVEWSMAVQYCAFAGKRSPPRPSGSSAPRCRWAHLPLGDNPPDATRANACGRECSAWSQKNGAEITPLYKRTTDSRSPLR